MTYGSHGRFPNRLLRASLLALSLVLAGSTLRDASGAMQRPNRNSVDHVLRRYEKVRVDSGEVARRVHESGELRFASRDQVFDVVLEPYDLRAPGYRAEEALPGGDFPVLDPAPVHTYRGFVPRLSDSEARFTVKDQSFEGVVLTRGEWYFIEPSRNFSADADPAEMVVYRRSDIRPDAVGVCGATLAHRVAEAHDAVEVQASASSAGISTADIATEADYEFVTASGGASAANAAILEILNQVDGIYQTELSVSLRVVYQHAWSDVNDPYTSTSPSTMLSEFRNYWNSNYYTNPYDLAHMWTGKDMDGSTVGIAYMGVVCDVRSFSYGISQRFSSAPGKYILTAHEIGHNFGASHPDQATPPQTECGNTIMNSFIGSGSTFCTFSRSEIAAYLVPNSNCLAAGPAAPSSLTAIAVSSSRINLSWQDNSADETGFLVERKQGAGGAWAQAGTTGANITTFSDSGLVSGTTYFYRVAANTAGGASGYSNEASAATMAGLPQITSISPTSGRSGTLVTINGANLNGTTSVRFNAVNASGFTVVSPTQVTATVPAGAGTGYVSLSTATGTASSSEVFTVQASSRCDINNDGFVNVLDMQLLINAILLVPGSPLNCDINSDGRINVLDLQSLINVILGTAVCPG